MPAPANRSGLWSILSPVAVRRRAVLRLGIGALATLLAPIFPALARGVGRGRPPETTLAAYLDTLIPRDEAPGALDLGGLEHLLGRAETDLKLGVLVRHGVAWLDEAARGGHGSPFADLESAEREGIVESASKAPAGSLPRLFFEETRRAALRHYYAHPEAWPALGYRGPPQPAGFKDYTEPPT